MPAALGHVASCQILFLRCAEEGNDAGFDVRGQDFTSLLLVMRILSCCFCSLDHRTELVLETTVLAANVMSTTFSNLPHHSGYA